MVPQHVSCPAALSVQGMPFKTLPTGDGYEGPSSSGVVEETIDHSPPASRRGTRAPQQRPVDEPPLCRAAHVVPSRVESWFTATLSKLEPTSVGTETRVEPVSATW
ncbi:MAG TPA: hypothetical protein DEF51_29395 [Myxococcales bacterium]|nr:hypothetical protein [Myxococcales bacterium]